MVICYWLDSGEGVDYGPIVSDSKDSDMGRGEGGGGGLTNVH